MTDRPILFSAPMVRAILAGTKTQTRRVMRDQLVAPGIVQMAGPGHCEIINGHGVRIPGFRCPYGQPGDRLWARETWGFNPDFPRQFGHICFRADLGHEYDGIKWVPSIHMPRRASRITLEVTAVRVERLQDISADDARAEGCPDKPVPGAEQASVDLLAKLWFHDLWAQINGQASWDANPWVWVVEFRRMP